MDMLFGFFPSFWKDIAIFAPPTKIRNAFCQVKVSELEPAFISRQRETLCSGCTWCPMSVSLRWHWLNLTSSWKRMEALSLGRIFFSETTWGPPVNLGTNSISYQVSTTRLGPMIFFAFPTREGYICKFPIQRKPQSWWTRWAPKMIAISGVVTAIHGRKKWVTGVISSFSSL